MPQNDPAAPPPPDTVFDWPVRIYYEDTDAGGVVYHANYITYMERARTEYLRDLGIEQDTLSREHGIIFAVRSVEVHYLAPARFNDLLRVSVSRPVGRGASVNFYQTVCRGDDTLVTAQVRIVSLDPASLRPRRLPAFLLTECSIGQ
jgi:acyl-CoA thioester hydrolase